jgi:hypothetical protein
MAGTRKTGPVLAALGLAVVAVVGIALFEPNTRASFSPYMYSEGAGVRQYDYRYFGLVPYSKTVPVSGLMTEQKVADHLARSGVVMPPGLDPFSKNAATSRTFYGDSVGSTLYFSEKSGLLSFYSHFKSQARQVEVDSLNSDGTWMLEWTAADGVTKIRVSGSNSYERGTRKVAGEMLHVHVSSPTEN